MFRSVTGLLACAGLLVPVSGTAAPFEGFGIGLGAANHGLTVDAESTAETISASESTSEIGAVIDIGFAGRPGSSNFFLEGGLRLYPVEVGTDVYSYDYVEVSDIGVLYVHLGGVINERNVVYGILESGSADVTVQTDTYEDLSGDIDTFGAGVGYRRWINDNAEFFVEAIGRTYDEIQVTYINGGLVGHSTEYEPTGASVTAGFTLRF